MPTQHHNADQSNATSQAHTEIYERLPEYATAAALGSAPEALYPNIAAHLAQCAACRAELDELLELTLCAYDGMLTRSPSYPHANLAFLPTPEVRPAPARPWLIDERGRLLISLSQPLLASSASSLTGAARGRLLYRYIQDPGSVEDLEVTIEVFAEDTTRRHGRVQVVVDVPSRGPLDQIGSRVILRADDHEWEGETDESGCVDFAPIPLDAVPQLRVEIAPLREIEN
jgi:hypothetical protein